MQAAAPATQPAAVVTMTADWTFAPANVRIRQGQTVLWKNTSKETHTVTADPKIALDKKDVLLPAGAAAFDSGSIYPGKSYEHRFDVPGLYRYFCIPHELAGMVAEVQVNAPASQPATSRAPEAGLMAARAVAEANAAGVNPPSGEARKPQQGEFEHFWRWLGKFHPPATAYPLALLTAAVLALVFWNVTGRRLYYAAVIYCAVFGALAAIVAGTLGWFFGGFDLPDRSWLKSVHRWLGTATALWSIVVLVSFGASRSPARGGSRTWFHISLVIAAALVTVASFFGGAMVFGLNHYAW